MQGFQDRQRRLDDELSRCRQQLDDFAQRELHRQELLKNAVKEALHIQQIKHHKELEVTEERYRQENERLRKDTTTQMEQLLRSHQQSIDELKHMEQDKRDMIIADKNRMEEENKQFREDIQRLQLEVNLECMYTVLLFILLIPYLLTIRLLC